MKKCKRGKINTRREDIFAMRAGVGVNLDPSPIVASCAQICVSTGSQNFENVIFMR